MLSYIPVCVHETHCGQLPYPQTVSWSFRASLCLIKTIWDFLYIRKGEQLKLLWRQYGASIDPCELNIWRLWEKESALFSDPGLMRRCITNLYSSQHVVWDTSAHFTDEFLKSSRGHHILPVYSINWVVWETLQVPLREEQSRKHCFCSQRSGKQKRAPRQTCHWQQMSKSRRAGGKTRSSFSMKVMWEDSLVLSFGLILWVTVAVFTEQ